VSEKRKTDACPVRNPECPVYSLVAILTALSWLAHYVSEEFTADEKIL
jgi:hypothetical protein